MDPVLDDLASALRQNEARTLSLDIETSPNLVYEFNLWEPRPNHRKLVKPSQVMTFVAKYLGEDPVAHAVWDEGGYAEMIKHAWDLLDRCDILVSFNGWRFDIPYLDAAFLEQGLPPYRPFKSVDLYKVMRRFKFPFRNLEYLSTVLLNDWKVEHGGMDTWLGAMSGDPEARQTMLRYNTQDAILTEALYLYVLPWIYNHPHVTTASELQLTCNKCGSTELMGAGEYLAVVLSYRLYRCERCQGLVRAQYPRRRASTRGVR